LNTKLSINDICFFVVGEGFDTNDPPPQPYMKGGSKMKAYYECWICKRSFSFDSKKLKVTVNGHVYYICTECFEALEDHGSPISMNNDGSLILKDTVEVRPVYTNRTTNQKVVTLRKLKDAKVVVVIQIR